MSSWIAAELEEADFGDKRLNKRLCKMVSSFFDHPESSVPKACGSWKDTKAAYNFWSSSKVKTAEILSSHVSRTVERASSQDRVLCIQDTTPFNFTHHSSTEGLGYLEKIFMHGFFLHNSLCVTCEGVPLGLLDQQYWARPFDEYGKRKNRHQTSIRKKESHRWLEAQQTTSDLIPTSTEVVTIADREADLYDLFEADRSANAHLLIRAAQNRRITHECKYLFTAADEAPLLGYHNVHIQSGKDRPARDARFEIRVTRVQMKPPQSKAGKNTRPAIPVQVVVAQEIQAPKDVEPVRWILTTTLPVETLDDALLVVNYYTLRWLVERFHFTLKSGCVVEKLQLKTAGALQNAMATYSIVAWRLMWMMYLSRQTPQTPAAQVLDQDEIEALYVNTFQKNLDKKTILTIQQAMLYIAKLGGFLARKRDGMPGIKVLWRGWIRLTDITNTWRLAKACNRPP